MSAITKLSSKRLHKPRSYYVGHYESSENFLFFKTSVSFINKISVALFNIITSEFHTFLPSKYQLPETGFKEFLWCNVNPLFEILLHFLQRIISFSTHRFFQFIKRVKVTRSKVGRMDRVGEQFPLWFGYGSHRKVCLVRNRALSFWSCGRAFNFPGLFLANAFRSGPFSRSE